MIAEDLKTSPGSQTITYTNYDVIFTPTIMSQQLPNRLVHKAAKTARFWPQNHFFARITPKPDYIYLVNFSREIFSKKNFVTRDSLGILGVPISKLA